MKITTRGLTFDVAVGGPEGGPLVLLLHGFPQHHGEWDGVVPVLRSAGLRTAAVDQRGYSPGARPPAVADYRIADCALDAASIVDALGYQDAHVVGHDWGAACGWHLALRHPERVRTLTAVSVPHPLAMSHAMSTEDDQRERSSYMKLFRQAGHAEELLVEDGARRLRELFDGSGLDDAGVDRYLAPLLAPGALTGALNWYRASSRADVADLGSVNLPTTFVWSDGDMAIGPVAARECARFVDADYRFVPLAGVSHWIPDQAPEAVVEAVLARIAG